MREEIKCIECRKETSRDEMYITVNGETICPICFKKFYYKCKKCGNICFFTEAWYNTGKSEGICRSCEREYKSLKSVYEDVLYYMCKHGKNTKDAGEYIEKFLKKANLYSAERYEYLLNLAMKRKKYHDEVIKEEIKNEV